MRAVLARAAVAVLLTLVAAGGLAGCSVGATPVPPGGSNGISSASPGGPGGASPGASSSPGSTAPGASRAPSASASPGAVASGPVTSADEAVSRVLAQDPRFAGIKAKDPNMIGQAAWYTVAPATDGWTVLVRIGWGDCPSGCIDEHVWTYAVGRDGTVRLVSEVGPEVPASPSA